MLAGWWWVASAASSPAECSGCGERRRSTLWVRTTCLPRFAPRAVLLQERNRGRSTRPGCENVLAPFAPRAVLLQGRSRGRSTRVGCENVLAQVRTEGGAPAGARPV